uniref:Uncharacterized protein n=1 Tax=Anguilla anguilla TaxID=7936 RepID=A0A0E9PMX4_ANGAN
MKDVLTTNCLGINLWYGLMFKSIQCQMFVN